MASLPRRHGNICHLLQNAPYRGIFVVDMTGVNMVLLLTFLLKCGIMAVSNLYNLISRGRYVI